MRRFFDSFDIWPPAVAKSGAQEILQTLSRESSDSQISQLVAAKSPSTEILPPLVAKSEDRLTINFSKHAHLGWTHYRILLAVTHSQASGKPNELFPILIRQEYAGLMNSSRSSSGRSMLVA